MTKKCVLLYSGGLDTSCMLKWIQENYGCELITLTLDVGQMGEDIEAAKKKALKLGAKKAYVLDVKKEFAEEYVAMAIKANALYEGAYPVSTAIARPLMAMKAIEIAAKEGAAAIAHGCTGKGNDQVRFDATIIALAPHIKIIAPAREWGMSREEEIAYAEKNNIPVPNSISSPYSTDENLWGKSTECGILEHPDKEPPEEIFQVSTPPEKAPETSEYVKIGFKSGIPVSLNNKQMQLHKLIQKLNSVAGKHGVGIIDHMEDRIVGLKSREIYECPAATVIIKAHKDIEKYVSTIHQNHMKPMIDQKWAYLTYVGLWMDPLMDDLNHYIDSVNKKVNGWVKVKLYKGKATVVARDSLYALYDYNLATYEKGDTFNQSASNGFIELWTLQTKITNEVMNNDYAG